MSKFGPWLGQTGPVGSGSLQIRGPKHDLLLRTRALPGRLLGYSFANRMIINLHDQLVDQSATLQGCAWLFLLSFRGRVALAHLENLHESSKRMAQSVCCKTATQPRRVPAATRPPFWSKSRRRARRFLRGFDKLGFGDTPRNSLSVLCSLEVGKTYILSIIVECRVLEDNSSVHWDSDPSNSFLGAESERSDQGTQVSTNSEGRTGACTGGEWLTFRN